MTNDTTAPIGARLRAWRTAQGVDQNRAAKLLGISQTLVSMIETGKRRPTMVGKYTSKVIERLIAGDAPALPVEPEGANVVEHADVVAEGGGEDCAAANFAAANFAAAMERIAQRNAGTP